MAITYSDKVLLNPNANPAINVWRAVDANEVKNVVNAHLIDTANPHSVTATQVGLGNVDNTADANKPVSTAQQTALDLKADLAGPTFTGVPSAPTAALGTNTTQIATTAFVLANAFSPSASAIWVGQNSYNAFPVSVLGNGQANLEFFNIGNPLGNTEDRNLVPGGVYRHTGSVIMGRNAIWNDANDRWEYSYSTADGYGTSWVECGGEGMNFCAAPVGTHPYQMETGGMNFSMRANGPRSVTGFTSGYVNQTMSSLIGVYESTASGLGQWLSAATQPIFWSVSEEIKGSATTLGEHYRAESHGNSASNYGGYAFKHSEGTLGTPANVTTNRIMGSIFSVAYGGAYRRTAEINFMSRGTVSAGAVGQGILFRTSVDTEANMADRFEVTADGVVRGYAPFAYSNSSISGVPVYSSFAALSPANIASEVMRAQHLSTSTGGARFIGFSTTSTASTAIALAFTGILGATAPTAPAMLFQALKNSGSASATDIAAAEIMVHFRNNTTTHIEILGSGNVGLGVTTPTAVLHIKAGTATAGTAPIKFTTGTNTTAAVAGQMEYNNTFHLTNSDGTRRHITLCTTATKTTAAAPYTNDGFITVSIGGTDVKVMTTA